MAQFIGQKRDMFLLHMSLQTKRNEIQKLEEKAAMKEEALRKSELMLEEDAMRFDAFLKENDRRAHEALKRADRESKEKNERLLDIKKLNAEIGKVEGEMNKAQEQLTNCLKYKHFLDQLTDPAFLRAEEKRKAERIQERRRSKEERRKNRLRARAAQEALTSHRSPKPTATQISAGGASDKNPRGVNFRHTATGTSSQHDDGEAAAVHPSSDESDDSAASDDDCGSESCGEEAMYFTSPHQLLDIFSQLEERNLFLIQNVQETEESLEEMKAKYVEMEAEMSEKSQQLQHNIEEMRKKIDREREKTEALHNKKKVMGVLGDLQGPLDAERVVDLLREQIKAVYRKSGFDADTQTDTLDMLRDIEGWLAHLLNEIRSMDPVKVEHAEKRKNAERRTMIRQAKKEEQKRLYEERLAKSTARATAEVVRHSGKPVMTRSAPLRKKVKEQDVQQVDEEAEELKRYFS